MLHETILGVSNFNYYTIKVWITTLMIHPEGVDLHQKGRSSTPPGCKIKNTLDGVNLTPLKLSVKVTNDFNARSIPRLIERITYK